MRRTDPRREAMAGRTALVLGGGGARGAYEVGVVQYLLETLAPELGVAMPARILCGTSAGALNTCVLAAWAHAPIEGVGLLGRRWTDLRVSTVVRPDRREINAMIRTLLRLGPCPPQRRKLKGGILDPAPFRKLLATSVPFERIAEHLAARRIDAVSISATAVATGRTAIFVQRATPELPPWNHRASIEPRAAVLTAEHALASAAIPVLLPPMRLDGHLYCDGSLRQNVPLSPARRLGADRLIVVSPRSRAPEAGPASGDTIAPGPVFLIGKALNALIVDRLESDLDRLQRINGILEAGARAFGPGFLGALNRELAREPGRGVRPVEVAQVRPSEDLGKLSADHVRSKAFRRGVRGPLGAVFQRLAEGEAEHQADLLSYLLFDGRFAADLIALGHADARREHDALAALLEPDGDDDTPGTAKVAARGA